MWIWEVQVTSLTRLNNTEAVQDISYVETSMLNYILQVLKPASCHPPPHLRDLPSQYLLRNRSIFFIHWVSDWAEVLEELWRSNAKIKCWHNLTTSRAHPRRHSYSQTFILSCYINFAVFLAQMAELIVQLVKGQKLSVCVCVLTRVAQIKQLHRDL